MSDEKPEEKNPDNGKKPQLFPAGQAKEMLANIAKQEKLHRFIGLMCPSERFPETAKTLEDNGFEVISGSLVFILPTGNGQLTSFSFVCGRINRLADITAIELKVKADSERIVKPV